MPADVTDLRPLVHRKMDQFIALCKAQGITLLVTQGFRSKAQQDALYAQGRTTPGSIVTNARGGYSFHNYGCAFDVCFVLNNQVSWNGDWDKLGQIAATIGLEHGDRGYIDKPHFQLRLGYSLEDFINNKVDWTKFA